MSPLTNAKEEAQRVEMTVAECTEVLVSQVQAYSRLQEPGWKRVKELALAAYDKMPDDERLRLASLSGHWPIFSPREIDPQIYVELSTGKLVNGLNPHYPASKTDLLQLAGDLSKINTAKICEDLEHILRRK
ncbi:hypothetical protein HY501_03220 [Candidatus Woesearchaeota archaeon]|nr:hypothetical protein [Candidatus Woesearchaeota archaeon]